MEPKSLSIGQSYKTRQTDKRYPVYNDAVVLDKAIFDTIFEKDIRRVFIYKKIERIAKALHLIAPAFANSLSLRNRLDASAVSLIDAAALPPSEQLSRELLILCSLLSLARTSGILSAMNAELITREIQSLLQEIANYEKPHIALDTVPTLADLAKHAAHSRTTPHSTAPSPRLSSAPISKTTTGVSKRQLTKDRVPKKDRREAILAIIKDKNKVNIKDIALLIRDISEKTIQRELNALIKIGMVRKEGERRWSTYSLA